MKLDPGVVALDAAVGTMAMASTVPSLSAHLIHLFLESKDFPLFLAFGDSTDVPCSLVVLLTLRPSASGLPSVLVGFLATLGPMEQQVTERT